MANEFWHSLITDKSFAALQTLRRELDFILIGGWAVYLYTQTLKSKDIDIVVSPGTLGKLKTRFDVIKNERLKKYEIKMDGFDVDIYLMFWSDLGLPAEFIAENELSMQGFKVPKKEILLVLKLYAYAARKGSLKGKKDALDVISLLSSGPVDFAKFRSVIQKFNLEKLIGELNTIVSSFTEVEELGLNKKRYSDFKKNVLISMKPEQN